MGPMMPLSWQFSFTVSCTATIDLHFNSKVDKVCPRGRKCRACKHAVDIQTLSSLLFSFLPDSWSHLQGWLPGPGFTHTTTPPLRQTWSAFQSWTSSSSRGSPSSPSISSWGSSLLPLPMHYLSTTRSCSQTLTPPFWTSTPRHLPWTSMGSALPGRVWPCCLSSMRSAF